MRRPRAAAATRNGCAGTLAVYRGPSRLTGEPVVVLLSGLARPSKNAKTGPMAQSWILPADTHPVRALRTGADAAVCGGCPLRPKVSGGSGACYVRVDHAPAILWRSWRAGRVPQVSPRDAARALRRAGRALRIGAYGDPAAVPPELWHTLARAAGRWTGYTHHWRTTPELRGRVCASVDSPEELQEAQALGWETYRVLRPGEARLPGEAQCPATAEAHYSRTCDTCPAALACSGRSGRPGRAARMLGPVGAVPLTPPTRLV